MAGSENDPLSGDLDLYDELLVSEDLAGASLNAEKLKEFEDLKAELSNSNGKIKELESELEISNRKNVILKKNISILYKTAKFEISRKDLLLKDLQRRYDQLLFKRLNVSSSQLQDLSINATLKESGEPSKCKEKNAPSVATVSTKNDCCQSLKSQPTMPAQKFPCSTERVKENEEFLSSSKLKESHYNNSTKSSKNSIQNTLKGSDSTVQSSQSRSIDLQSTIKRKGNEELRSSSTRERESRHDRHLRPSNNYSLQTSKRRREESNTHTSESHHNSSCSNAHKNIKEDYVTSSSRNKIRPNISTSSNNISLENSSKERRSAAPDSIRVWTLSSIGRQRK